MYVGGKARIFELGACLAENVFIVFDNKRTDITHLSPYHVRLLVRSQYSHQKPKGILLWQPTVGQCPGARMLWSERSHPHIAIHCYCSLSMQTKSCLKEYIKRRMRKTHEAT